MQEGPSSGTTRMIQCYPCKIGSNTSSVNMQQAAETIASHPEGTDATRAMLGQLL